MGALRMIHLCLLTSGPAAPQGELEESQNIVTASRHRYITVLRADVKALHADLQTLAAELGEFMLLGDIRQADERCAMAHALQKQLDECALACLGGLTSCRVFQAQVSDGLLDTRVAMSIGSAACMTC